MIRKVLLRGFLVVALLLVLFSASWAQFFVDALWFDSLGYSSVFWYSAWLRFGLFVGFFVLTAGLLRGAFYALERAFAAYPLGGTIRRFDDTSFRFTPDKFMRPLAWVVSLLWALMAGLAMCMRWDSFLLYLNGAAGQTPDPIFSKPIGYYLFVWPIHKMLASWLSGILVIVLVTALLYLFFTIASKLPTKLDSEARRTAYLTSSLALSGVLLVYAWQMYLGRFAQLWHEQNAFTGAGYTQANVMLPGLNIVVGVLLAAAAIAILNAVIWRRLRILVVALAAPLAVYVGLGLVANYVGNFVVKPNQLERETPYIQHNIDWTRRAFGLDQIEERNFPAKAGVAALQASTNKASLDNIRLWDWRALQDTLRQMQVLRTYYDFPDVDVDRYRINGQMRQVMIAARELDIDKLPENSRNWVNDRLIYTHGYGVTMNTANGFTPEGRPRYILSDMPVRSTAPEIKLTRPEIYFGQKTDSHVYVKTKKQNVEFDYPQGSANSYTTYNGSGGIKLGGAARRLLISWAMGDLSKVPFSNDITPETRLLMYRNIRIRAQRIAPFLTYDKDPYIVVGTDGRLYWIMDAYTSSLYYPYSRHYEVDGKWMNYMRNSVKVVIDAYNGSANFYVFDKQDPIVNAYRKAFPGMFKDSDAMPAGLLEHVRYPELQFQTQAEVYGLYHIRDVKVFFGREDVWSIARRANGNPTAAGEMRKTAMPNGPFGKAKVNPLTGQVLDEETSPIEPYFVLMHLPGEEQGEEFVPILPFTPANRRNMNGWMAGRSDGADYGKLFSYNFPKSEQVEGPAQVQARIDQDARLSEQFSLWNRSGSRVLRGNLLVIPLGTGLLYVEPIFLQADQSPNPELRLVVLATNDRIVYGTNFQEALTKLLGSSLGEIDEPAVQATTTRPAIGTVPNPTPAAVGDARQQKINRAAQDLEAYQKLTAEGKYGEAGKRLEALTRTLRELREP